MCKKSSTDQVHQILLQTVNTPAGEWLKLIATCLPSPEIYVCVCNCVWPFVTTWTVIHQAPLDTGVSCHFLLPDPVSNLNFLCLLDWQADSLPLCHGMVSKTSLSGLNWLPQNSQSLTYFSNACISLSEEKRKSTHNILDLELYHIHLKESCFGTVSL